MDKDRFERTAHQAKGAVKEALGKLTGDAKMEAEGTAEKAVGKARHTSVGDAVRR